MKDRVAIVTGASRGIGRAAAIALAEAGASVVINYAGSETAAKETEVLCQAHGAKTLLIQADVAKSEDCQRMVDETVAGFGKVDILVNNAGVTRDNLLMCMTDEEFDQVIATNLRGTYAMMKAVSRPMMKSRYGRIINMASVVGLMGNAGQVNYAASKAGVIGMTKSFAKEIAARGVTVNAVAPGFIATDMTAAMTDAAREAVAGSIPMKRMGRPEDVAAVVRFLASEAAGYVTGQTLAVDGGLY